MSPVTLHSLADVLLYKIFNHCSLTDRLVAVELVNDRWRRLSQHADASREQRHDFETFSTKDFQKVTVTSHFLFNTQNQPAEPIELPERESNEFLLSLFNHVLPRIGQNLELIEILPKLPTELQVGNVGEDNDENVDSGIQISRQAVDLMLRHCPKLRKIDFGQTFCDEETAEMLTRLTKLEGVIFRVASDRADSYLPDLLHRLKLTTLGTAQGPIACFDKSRLRSLQLYNSWHEDFESIKTKLHVHFPNLEEIHRGKSRIYLDNGSSSASDDDEDDRKYLSSVCRLKNLRRFDDMTSVVKSEADLDQILKSCPNFKSLRLTATFEGNLYPALSANWIRRIRTVCLCDLKLDLKCIRTIFTIGTMTTLRLNSFMDDDVIEEAEEVERLEKERASADASASDEDKDKAGDKRSLIGQCAAYLRHVMIRVRGQQTHQWANRMTKELLESERVVFKSYDGIFICDQETLASFGKYAEAGKSHRMIDLGLKTSSVSLHPIFSSTRRWPNVRRLEICHISAPSKSPIASTSLMYLKPLLTSKFPNLRHLVTKVHFPMCDPSELESSSSDDEDYEYFPSHLIPTNWPRLRIWHTAEVSVEREAYDLIRNLTAHPSMERASVNGLFSKWNVASVNRASRLGREMLHVRSGLRMHALTVTLLSNGERLGECTKGSEQRVRGRSVFQMSSLWDVYNVDMS